MINLFLSIATKVFISLYALIYVDDILITGSSSVLIHDLNNKLHTAFALKKLDKPSCFLGIKVKFHSNGPLFPTQSKYIKDLLSRTKMDNANGVPTTMLSTCKLSKHGNNQIFDLQLCRSIVGVLQYVTLTRTNIVFNVNKAYRFMVYPLNIHW